MRIFVLTTALLLSFAILNYSSPASAWGERAHQTIGEIASRHLTPRTQQAVADILGVESIAFAAKWPDEMREEPEFAVFAPYHILNMSTGVTYATRPESEKDPKDAVTVLGKYPDLLKDPKVPRSVKMVALRYLIHVIADIHQPLHVGNRLDSGGNACKVESKPGKIENLHGLWDREFVDDDMDQFRALRTGKKFYRYNDYADDILKFNALPAAELAKIRSGTYQDWINETRKLHPLVYPDTTPTEDSKREYCQRSTDPKNIPVLSDAYKKLATSTVQRQVLLAGLRTAEMLNQVFAVPVLPGPNSAMTKSEILKQLDLKN
jgi:S1/P1 Nuclease